MIKTIKEFRPGLGFTKADWDEVSADDGDATPEELAQARPFAEVFPELAETFSGVREARTKEAISIRLDRDIVDRLRATGPGWQSRVNDALRDWLAKTPA